MEKILRINFDQLLLDFACRQKNPKFFAFSFFYYLWYLKSYTKIPKTHVLQLHSGGKINQLLDDGFQLLDQIGNKSERILAGGDLQKLAQNVE
jgi:hypothetical protein